MLWKIAPDAATQCCYPVLCSRGGFFRFMACAGQIVCERFTVHWLSNGEIQQSVLAREEISGSLDVPFLRTAFFRFSFSYLLSQQQTTETLTFKFG